MISDFSEVTEEASNLRMEAPILARFADDNVDQDGSTSRLENYLRRGYYLAYEDHTELQRQYREVFEKTRKTRVVAIRAVEMGDMKRYGILVLNGYESDLSSRENDISTITVSKNENLRHKNE